MTKPGRWMWRADRLSHLVNMEGDWELSYCGVRAPFSTQGADDFYACKRCLRAARAGTVAVTAAAPRLSHLEIARGG